MIVFGYPLAVVLAASAIAIFTMGAGALLTSIGPWYRSLVKPAWQPPDWLFGPAWTLIFILAAIAAIDSYSNAPASARIAVITVFMINMILNVAWSLFFFTLKSPQSALYEVVLLWLSIVSIMVVIWPWSRLGVYLLLPYLVWVSFAAFLTYTIVKLNYANQ